jgi:hypothetical protein
MRAVQPADVEGSRMRKRVEAGVSFADDPGVLGAPAIGWRLGLVLRV